MAYNAANLSNLPGHLNRTREVLPLLRMLHGEDGEKAISP